MNKLKKNKFIFLFTYLICAGLFFLWVGNNYSSWDSRLLISLLILLVVGFSVTFDLNSNDMLFSQGVVFNGFALLYSCHFIFNSILYNLDISDNAFYLQTLALVSIISFNITYLFFPRLSWFQKSNYSQYNFKIIRLLSFFLLLISMLAEFYVVFRQIGLSTILSNTRASTSLIMSDYSVLSFYRYTFPLLTGIFLLLYFNLNSKIDLLLLLIALFFAVSNSFIYLSRSNMLAVLLPFCFLLEYYRKISRRVLIILVIMIFLLFGVWKSMFSTQTIYAYNSEFGTWYRIGENILNDSSIGLKLGESYLGTLINLVVPVTHIESLSHWYVRTYEYNTYLIGGGRGFSGIIEAYINFAIIGNIIIFAFFGFVFKQVNKNSHLNIIIYIIFLLSIPQIFRADSYSMWKNMMWFRIYPTMIIFGLAKNFSKFSK